MNRRYLWRQLHLLAVVVLLVLGADLAFAGPGGGTYYANSPAGGNSGTALRKFVDSLPGLGSANANNLGQYIPVATPDTTTFPGADYYEIGLRDYAVKMHSDLPKPTKLRGYYQINSTDTTVQNVNQYLGPLIIGRSYDPTKPAGVNGNGKPIRVSFFNNLSTSTKGNLFIPVDTSLMGAGKGPYDANGNTCDPTVLGNNCVNYTQNRATIHLHGGNSPWISDGTPHQWTAPKGETSVPLLMRKGVSARGVPDMWYDSTTGALIPSCAGQLVCGVANATREPPGQLSFYWTNEQSNRLMFYHDHSYGITRLNVYAGEAAGFLLVDQFEDDLIDGTNVAGANPGGLKVLPNLGGVYRYGIPLVIQDKTFVPKNIDVQDAGWNFNLISSPAGGPAYQTTNVARNKTTYPWGAYGDLWFPHVYEANQDPASPDGANPFGRWDYGPWFWPPVVITDPAKKIVPDPSTSPEAFMDTMLVNGTAYPYLTVTPQLYRFRILNASNDRTLNLQLYYADPNDPSGKEVKMVPAAATPTFPADWPTDGRAGGVPDPALVGPNMVQIGTESGFIRNPAVIPNHPVNYEYNRRNIVVLNVNQYALGLGPAERADVLIDFSKVPPGSTLILYNDGPAPNPGFDPRIDYYTGDPDQTASGGAPSTLRGLGPNTRTIMQFRVVAGGTPGTAFSMANLQTALPAAFDASQPAPLVPQVWNGAPTDLYSRIQDYSFTIPLNTLANPVPAAKLPTTIPFQPKAIQELWDPWGRMNATLGVELSFTSNLTQTTIPMGYAEPVTERITDGQPQIWKITHNGVDTHPVHFHMMSVQLVNRVGWDGAIRPPDPNELGWKETVRMNPLEDAIVAIVPKKMTTNANIDAWLATPANHSNRLIDPTLPATANISATDIGNLGRGGSPTNAVTVNNFPNNDPATNDLEYEYVWHCHILGHEENDFMRPMVFSVSTAVPPAPSFTATVPAGTSPYTPRAGGAFKGGQTVPGKSAPGPGATTVVYVASYVNPSVNQVVLQWKDGTLTEAKPSSFLIQRSTDGGATYTNLATVSYLPGFPPIYTDPMVDPGVTYTYQVAAFNVMGPSTPPASTSVTTDTWTIPTGVTVNVNKPTPHVVGTDAVFTATGSGATTAVAGTTVAYLYRFSLQTGTAAPVVVQDWGSDNTWVLPASTPVGSYAVKVDVKTSASATTFISATTSYNVVPTPVPPVTVASPVPAIYAAAPVTVTLTATTNAPPARIFYTLDGTMPTTASTQYTVPIVLNATTTINYFAVDANGTAEAVHSDTWYIHVSDMVASVTINGGAAVTNNPAVNLTLSAFDPTGIKSMMFSNTGGANATEWSAEEPYATSKSWSLDSASGDGQKTVYVRFRDKALPTGVLYPPVTSSITLDVTPPVTSATPLPGEYANGPISVTLTCSDGTGSGCGKIYYTTDGTTPTTASSVYVAALPINNNPGQTTTIKYFSVDKAGNAEAVKTGAWTMHIADLVASVKINNGANWTDKSMVTLTLSAFDPDGVSTMQFSNDGVTYQTFDPVNRVFVPINAPRDEATYATSYSWQLSPGEGLKTVYVKFRDASQGGGNLYAPVTSTILFGTKDGMLPGTSSLVASSLRALQIANKVVSPSPMDMVHGDVAPYSNGAAQPDGKIDLMDVYAILLRMVGLISTY